MSVIPGRQLTGGVADPGQAAFGVAKNFLCRDISCAKTLHAQLQTILYVEKFSPEASFHALWQNMWNAVAEVDMKLPGQALVPLRYWADKVYFPDAGNPDALQGFFQCSQVVLSPDGGKDDLFRSFVMNHFDYMIIDLLAVWTRLDVDFQQRRTAGGSSLNYLGFWVLESKISGIQVRGM